MIGVKCSKVVVATPNTIIVPSPGFETIQEAINAANPGDIIKVSAGIYNENLLVNKAVSIIGENPVNTVIYGNGAGHVVNIIGSNVIFSGFAIQNATNWPYCGISLKCNSTVVNNTILKNNYYGLQLTQSHDNTIMNNLITNNSYSGLTISSSTNNVLFQNTIQNNFIGLWSSSSSQNAVYHNNFINNTNQLMIFTSPTIWDNGAEGNYWSDYEGLDVNLNGIGDSQYPPAGDKYPLMGFFTNFIISYDSIEYSLPTICNSTILNFQFDNLHGKISYDALGPNGTIGFCRIGIPVIFIQPKYSILVDENVPFFRNWTADTYGYIYFLYANSGATRKVMIEFELPGKASPPFLLVFILIAAPSIAIILVLIIFKKKLGKKARE
jgi:parallel beta-helix repeat protein